MANKTMQETAEDWAGVFDEIKMAEARVRQAQIESDNLRSKLDTLTRELTGKVGSNISLRVFQISDTELVIVEYGKGIRKQKVESKEL